MRKITSNEVEIDLRTEVQMIRDRKQSKMLSQGNKRKFLKAKFKITSIESILKLEKKKTIELLRTSRVSNKRGEGKQSP